MRERKKYISRSRETKRTKIIGKTKANEEVEEDEKRKQGRRLRKGPTLVS